MTAAVADGSRLNDVSWRPSSFRHGFTLIELVAVLVLMAIFASLAAVTVRGQLVGARLEQSLERIEALDGRLRDEADRLQRAGELRIDLNGGRVYQSAGGRELPPSRTVALDDAIKIERIRTARRTTLHGELRVPISANGQSDSYALCLASSSGRKVWLVVLGATGQSVRLNEERDVARYLSPVW